MSFIPTLAPSLYLENINFTNLIVYGRVDDTICFEFQQTAEDFVKQYLEGIDAEQFLAKKCEQEESEN